MTFRDMLLGSHWAGRVWTGRGDGTAGAGDPGAHGGARGGWVVGGGEAYVSPSSCRRRMRIRG
jgi:hypothetical protein